MKVPFNTTNLSIAGVVQWLLLLMAGISLIPAYQGIVNRKLQTGGRSRVEFLYGSDAVRAGFAALLVAGGFALGAFLVWYFWQRNED